MIPTRRVFLKNGALAMAGVGLAPKWLARAAYAAEGGGRKKILVAIFQRGACDGLNTVVPYGDKRYYDLRPNIAIPQKSLLDLDGFFGLHPTLEPLKPVWDAKQLAIIEAVGSPDPTRSHFDAQDYMESGTPGFKSTRDGWLNRSLRPDKLASPVRAVSLGTNLARAMRGTHPAIAVTNIGDFQVKDEMSAMAFQGMYAATPDRTLNGTGRDTFEAVKILQSVQKQAYTPANGAQYPIGRFGQSMLQIARLIKAGVGVEVAFADMGGWDTHVNEVAGSPTQGQLANLLAEFGQGLGAFYKDMGERMEDIVLVTMSEFGRTARENGNRGTDHGHGGVMFAMGAQVKGGKVYGDWPGLESEQLYEGRDLNLTTDFRDVLGELVTRHLGTQDIAKVFPRYEKAKFRGVLA